MLFCLLQHEGARKAFEDAQKKLEDISEMIRTKSAAITSIKNDLEIKKSEVSNARKVEQVSAMIIGLFV